MSNERQNPSVSNVLCHEQCFYFILFVPAKFKILTEYFVDAKGIAKTYI